MISIKREGWSWLAAKTNLNGSSPVTLTRINCSHDFLGGLEEHFFDHWCRGQPLTGLWVEKNGALSPCGILGGKHALSSRPSPEPCGPMITRGDQGPLIDEAYTVTIRSPLHISYATRSSAADR